MSQLNVWVLPAALTVGCHGIIVYAMGKLIIKQLDDNDKGVLAWLLMVSYLVPVIGPLLSLATLAAANRSLKVDRPEEDGGAVPLRLDNQRLLLEDMTGQEAVSIAQAFTHGEPEAHKDLIIKLMESGIIGKGHYLQQALGTRHEETVHYAATTMNALKDRFEQTITRQHQEKNPAHADSYQKLSHSYDRYVNSGVLPDTFLKRVLDEYSTFLLEAARLFPHDVSYYEQLATVYRKQQNHHELFQVCQVMMKRFKKQHAGYFHAMQFHFDRNDYPMMRITYKKMMLYVHPHEIPAVYQPLINQLSVMLGSLVPTKGDGVAN